MVLVGCQKHLDTNISSSDEIKIYKLTHKSTNVYLLQNKGRFILIDAAYNSSLDKIKSFLDLHRVTSEKLAALVLTHAHEDHAGAASEIKLQYGIPVIGGQADLQYYQSGEGVPICPTSGLAKVFSWFSKPQFPAIDLDKTVSASDTLILDDWPLKIYNLSGHTPGSLIIEGDKFVFVGDLIRGGIFNSSQPKRHFFICDEKDNDEDTRWLLKRHGRSIWYPGHYGPLSGEEVKEEF